MKIKIKKVKNADLKNYCSFKIGGKAKCIYFPENIRQIKYLINALKNKNKEYLILGNGTNILFPDKKLKKIIICLKKLNEIQINGEEIVCGAGANLFNLNSACAQNSLEGLEFTYGLPGSVGGAVSMNAGAFGDEICNHLFEIVVCKDGEIYSRQNLKFRYRKGPLEKGEILLFAKFKLKKGEKQKIIQIQHDFLQKRRDTQPYGECSAGSVFRRGENFIPAKLIDEWGLKGLKIGGCEISKKHAGFIVSAGKARQSDALALIELIEWVAKAKGYIFEREIVVVTN